MAYSRLLFEEADGIFRITLNRPERINAFDVGMHEELRDALNRVAVHVAPRVVLLTGAGKGFCAGQDLAERDVSKGPLDLGVGPDRFYNPLVRQIAALPVPVVCAVNGVAAGAGASIALACDIVIAKASANFAPAFGKIGLVPDSGGTWHAPRLMGLARAMGFYLTADPVPATQAEAWGLIWKAVPDEQFAAEVDALVQKLGSGPTKGLAATKKALRASFSNTFDAQLDLERDLQKACGLSDDYREGVSAFKEKRKPTFKGT